VKAGGTFEQHTSFREALGKVAASDDPYGKAIAMGMCYETCVRGSP